MSRYFSTGSFIPVKFGSAIGSTWQGMASGSIGTYVSIEREDALYHFQELKLAHLEQDEQVELFNKLVELLAAK